MYARWLIVLVMLVVSGCSRTQLQQSKSRVPETRASASIKSKVQTSRVEERHLEHLDRDGDDEVMRLYNLPLFEGDPRDVPSDAQDGDIVCASSEIPMTHAWTEQELGKPVGVVVYLDGRVWVVFDAVHEFTLGKYTVACPTHVGKNAIIVEQNRCCVSPKVYRKSQVEDGR